jgi:hypothetical protein
MDVLENLLCAIGLVAYVNRPLASCNESMIDPCNLQLTKQLYPFKKSLFRNGTAGTALATRIRQTNLFSGAIKWPT